MSNIDTVLIPQSGWLPIGADAANVAGSLISQNSAECKTARLMVDSGDATVVVTDFKVGGVSMNGTNLSVHHTFFSPNARLENTVYLGIPVRDRTEFLVQFSGKTLAANPIAASMTVDAVDEIERPIAEVKDYTEACPLYWGMGNFALLGATTSQRFSFTIQKGGSLGVLSMDILGATEVLRRNIHVTSFEINGLPVPNGPSFQRGFTLNMLANPDDIMGRILHALVKTSDVVSFTVDNDNAGPLTLVGGIYALHNIPGMVP